MSRKSTTEAKRSVNYRLLYLVGVPAICALLLWGGRRDPDSVARAAETTSAPAVATTPTNASAPATAALTIASLPNPNPLSEALSNGPLAPTGAAAAANLGEAEYKVPLPCEPPTDRIKDHPLEGYIAFMRSGKSTETRDWVLPLIVKALSTPMREANITGYSSRDSDGGGPYTRWGTRTRWGICAADGRYWGPGSVIWMGDPVNQVLVVEDTGGAVKGRDRFDVCTGDNPVSSSKIGRRHANYVPLYVAPTRSAWGDKPDDWRPPVPSSAKQ